MIGAKLIISTNNCVEYVDSEGELQYVDDPELLLAAAGSLGLLGVVTAITYKVIIFLFLPWCSVYKTYRILMFVFPS